MCLLKNYEQFNHLDAEKQLRDAGLWSNDGVVKTVWVLVSLIDRTQTVTIDGTKHVRGATFPTSQARLAERVGVERRATVNTYLRQLEDAGIIRKEDAGRGGHNCLRYIFTTFDRGAEQLRQEISERKAEEESASDEQKLTEKTCTPRRNAEEKGVREQKKPVRTEAKTCTPQSVHSPEYPDKSRISPSTGLGADTGIADPMPNEEVAETQDLHSKPDAAAAEPSDEQKNSRKEKNTDFFLSNSFHLADKFAGDELEFTPPELRKKRAAQFQDHLTNMFRSARVADACPDAAERLEKCTRILEIWVEIVKNRHEPAQFVGFMDTDAGMTALAKAQSQVIAAEQRKQKWTTSPSPGPPHGQRIFHLDEAPAQFQQILMRHVPNLCENKSFPLADLPTQLQYLCEENAYSAITDYR